MILDRIMFYVVVALGLSVAALSGWVWWSESQRDALQADLDRTKSDRREVTEDLKRCRGANTGWQTTLDTVQGALNLCVQRRDDAIAAGERATTQARQAAATAQASADAWRKRYDAARISPDCTATLEAQLCAAVSDY